MNHDIFKYVTSIDLAISTYQDRLIELIGKHLDLSWVLWNTKSDEWFSDAPVILRFDGIQMEISFRQLDELSISWGAIDIERKPDWYELGTPKDSLFEFGWKENALDELKKSLGNMIKDIYLGEYLYGPKILLDKVNPENIGKIFENWHINFIEFEFDQGSLAIYNSLDTNGITSDSIVGEQFRKTRITNTKNA